MRAVEFMASYSSPPASDNLAREARAATWHFPRLGSRPPFLSADDADAFDRGYRAGEEGLDHDGPRTPYRDGWAEGTLAWCRAERAQLDRDERLADERSEREEMLS